MNAFRLLYRFISSLLLLLLLFIRHQYLSNKHNVLIAKVASKYGFLFLLSSSSYSHTDSITLIKIKQLISKADIVPPAKPRLCAKQSQSFVDHRSSLLLGCKFLK